MPTTSRGYDAGKKITGRKRHLAVDTQGLLLAVLLAVVVTVAGIQDRDAGLRLLTGHRDVSTVRLIWADGGYAGRAVVWAKHVLGHNVQIVKRNDDTTGFTVLPRRWVVERTFAWTSKYRRCIRDYETRPDTHEALTHPAMIMPTPPRPPLAESPDALLRSPCNPDFHVALYGYRVRIVPRWRWV